MAQFVLKVNGTLREVDVLDNTPLLWVLRDSLDLTGTKYGCGAGLCGSCAVHLDGEVVRSCRVPVRSVGDRAVVTIEGLSPDGDHPVQRAWIAEDVPQCGYCQVGQIMTAADLLARKADPDDADIDATFVMNLCRCGTYPRIRRAVHRAAREMRQARAARTPQGGSGGTSS